MNLKQCLALLGFLFVAAWIAFDNFGYAILCLLGAALFYAAGAVLQGELDLGEMQSRVQRR
jgi:drug/metabolite transporter (DMT)-like permease